MASSRKARAPDPGQAVEHALATFEGRRLAIALSGGLDSVVLLHAMCTAPSRARHRRVAVHVHHGLHPAADAWARFCRELCRRQAIPFRLRRVEVERRSGAGVEAAARNARYAAFRDLDVDAVVLGHHLDDQAETVLLQLLRGAGPQGASGMPHRAIRGGMTFLRPMLDLPREALRAYAEAHALHWIDDPANADERYARNYLRHRIGPLLAARFPRWREALGRAARHFAGAQADAGAVLRMFLQAQGLRAPSEARLLDMLRQLGASGTRTRIEHDGAQLRVYRGRVHVLRTPPLAEGATVRWRGEPALALPGFGGMLRFERRRSVGIDAAVLEVGEVVVRARRPGDRLQPDPLRPRRTLKNLFQECGIPPWRRAGTPVLAVDGRLAWVAGIGWDVPLGARPGAPGIVPVWVPDDAGHAQPR